MGAEEVGKWVDGEDDGATGGMDAPLEVVRTGVGAVGREVG